MSIGLGLLLLVSCKSLDSNTLVSAQKMSALVESGSYEVTLDFANPMASTELNTLRLLSPDNTGNRMDISGNVNHIKYSEDSLDVRLSYYGTRFSGVTDISGGGGIVFKGKPENYKTSFNEKKQRTTISFGIRERAESYDVIIEVYPSSKAFLSINSSQRSSITYDGSISELVEE